MVQTLAENYQLGKFFIKKDGNTESLHIRLLKNGVLTTFEVDLTEEQE